MPKRKRRETPNEALARQMAELREQLGMSRAELGRRLAELGWEVDPTTLLRIERGPWRKDDRDGRTVTLDEALLIAAALGVSPSHLLVPRSTTDRLLIGNLEVEPDQAREWISGRLPLTDDADSFAFYSAVPESEMTPAFEKAIDHLQTAAMHAQEEVRRRMNQKAQAELKKRRGR